MKNVKFFCILLFISAFIISGFSQTSQGKFFLGGASTFSLNSYSEKWKSDDDNGIDGKGITFALQPMAGFFIIDGLVVGLDLQLYIDRYKDDSSDDVYTYTQVVVGPFVRYYIGSGKIKPYGHLAIGGGSAIDKYDPDGGSTDTEKFGIFAMQFGGGAAFFINDNVALDLGLLYQRYRTKAKEDNDDNYKDISQQFGLNVGVTALF